MHGEATFHFRISVVEEVLYRGLCSVTISDDEIITEKFAV